MLSENYYIQAQLNLLGIELALAAGDVPKRSGDFESTYKTATGAEITVKRSPDGKFANKGGGGAAPTQQTPTVSVEKAFAKPFSDFGDEIAKLPAKVQDAVRKAVFDSELSRAIDKEAEKLIERVDEHFRTLEKRMTEPAPGVKVLNKVYGNGLKVGFKLGQSIKDELAKKPFSEFGETVAKKFAEFKKELPQKSEDLKKEIIRIAKDPNTSTTVAAGALLGLAAYFHITGIQKILEVSKSVAGLSNAEILARINNYKLATPFAQQVKDTLVGIGDSGLFRNATALVLTSNAGRVIMNRVKSNEAIEKERLKKEILANKEDSDALYQQQLDQQARDAKTQQKLVEELQKDTPKTPEEMTAPDGTLAAPTPVFTVNLSDEDEAYVADPKNYEAVMTEAYKDEEFIKLAFAYTETQALEVLAIFTGSETEANKFHEIGEQATQAIKDRLTVVIKEEIKRQREIQKQ